MKILIASPIAPEAVEKLKESHDVVTALNASSQELQEAVRDREALVFRSGVQISADVMRSAPGLKLLVRAGCGLDNLDVEYVERKGLTLYRIRRPAAQAVSELAFTLMLTLARRILEADSGMRRGEWAKYRLTGRLLHGKTLGVVGAGNIGSRLGEMGAAWGMHPIGCVESPCPETAARLSRLGITLSPFERVLGDADFLAVTVPLQDSTRNLIDSQALALMKPGSFLVNVSRGGVVDERALHERLVAGDGPMGAALDVHAREGEGNRSELADLPNVVLTPHIGSMTVDTQHGIGAELVEIIESYSARLRADRSGGLLRAAAN